MAWTKVKRALESNVCKSLRKRLAFHMAIYRSNEFEHGRVWLEVDGEQVISINECDSCGAAERFHRRYVRERQEHDGRYMSHEQYYKRLRAALEQEGHFVTADFFRAIKKFHAHDIRSSIESDDPIQQLLAVIDRRIGKRTLRRMDPRSLHPMALRLFLIRLDAEEMTRPLGIAEPAGPFRKQAAASSSV